MIRLIKSIILYLYDIWLKLCRSRKIAVHTFLVNMARRRVKKAVVEEPIVKKGKKTAKKATKAKDTKK